MSNKIKLQENNLDLNEIFDSINNLPDAGSGGGGSVETGTFIITDNGMLEPGVNKYILSSPDLKATSRKIIVIMFHGAIVGLLVKSDTNDTFNGYNGATDCDCAIVYSGANSYITENEISMNGYYNITGYPHELSFIAI